MQDCDAFIAFGTRDYGESTGNPAATDQELFFWQNYMEKKGKALVPVRMIEWEEDFDHTAAKVLFNTNRLVLTWILGEPMPDDIIGDLTKALKLPPLPVAAPPPTAPHGSTPTPAALLTVTMPSADEGKAIVVQTPDGACVEVVPPPGLEAGGQFQVQM